MSDQFSADEIGKLKEFRRRVSSSLKDDYQRNDAFLITWLRARQLNVNKAEEMFRNSLEWRKVNKVDDILERETIPEKYMKKTPFAYCGQDESTGCPVFLYAMGRHDVRSMIEAEGLGNMIRYNIIFMETIVKLMQDLWQKSGKPVTQFIEIIDLDGYSLRQFGSKQCLDIMAKTQLMFDLNYPEVIRHITLINAPKIFTLFYNFMKPLIPKETLAKIDILGPDVDKWKQFLQTKYPMELIPKRWGGTLVGSDEFCSQSSIWLFGPLPLQYFTNADEDGFIKARVRPRGKLELEFDVCVPSTLTWKFKTDSCFDIGFGVLFENKEVVPIKRILTPGAVQEGMLECKNSGKCIVVFDNTYSYTRAKTIHHNITLVPKVVNMEENALRKFITIAK